MAILLLSRLICIKTFSCNKHKIVRKYVFKQSTRKNLNLCKLQAQLK